MNNAVVYKPPISASPKNNPSYSTMDWLDRIEFSLVMLSKLNLSTPAVVTAVTRITLSKLHKRPAGEEFPPRVGKPATIFAEATRAVFDSVVGSLIFEIFTSPAFPKENKYEFKTEIPPEATCPVGKKTELLN